MKALLSCLALALALVSSAANAQEIPVNPVHPNAQYLGKFTTTVTIAGQVTGQTGQVGTHITVWALGGGKTEYQIKTKSIDVTGDAAAIDALSTPEIFSLLAQAAVAQGVSLGYTTASSVCSTNPESLVSVIQNNCVKRKESGSDTYFRACDSNKWGTKSFSVCAPAGAGSLVINLVDTDSETCNPGNNGNCLSTFE